MNEFNEEEEKVYSENRPNILNSQSSTYEYYYKLVAKLNGK